MIPTPNSNAMLRLAALILLATTSAAFAQEPFSSLPPATPIPTPEEPDAIPIYPATKETQQEEQWVSLMGQRMVRNVTTATLTPFLPPAGKATGAAVIVAPGGAFYVLAMDNEGYPVARYLADHGIAAFLLKYRLEPTPRDEAGFGKMMSERMSRVIKADSNTPPPSTPASAAMDGATAIKLVRARAAEWGVNPERIGMIGFSAGAMLTLSTALAEKAGDRPAFVGLIYGPMNRVAVPADAPPAFIALAANDPLFAKGRFELVDAWREARRPVEFHLYQEGDHGFGMRLHSGTYALWKEQFVEWMKWNGWLGEKGS
jgi:acetyl esterase/lipase